MLQENSFTKTSSQAWLMCSTRPKHHRFEVVSGQDQEREQGDDFSSITSCGDGLVLYQNFATHAVPTARLATDGKDFSTFQMLAKRWIIERGASSSITENAICDAYQRIIGMGERALRPIFRRLESEADDPDQWFWALQMITGQDPVAPEDRGNFRRMAQAWLEWARCEGYAL